jgi:hypothetical protein
MGYILGITSTVNDLLLRFFGRGKPSSKFKRTKSCKRKYELHALRNYDQPIHYFRGIADPQYQQLSVESRVVINQNWQIHNFAYGLKCVHDQQSFLNGLHSWDYIDGVSDLLLHFLG